MATNDIVVKTDCSNEDMETMQLSCVRACVHACVRELLHEW